MLNKKSDHREFQIGSFGGITGGKSGVHKDKEAPFRAEHIGIRVYKITLDEALKPGEYAFFMGTGQSNTMAGARGGNRSGGSASGRVLGFHDSGVKLEMISALRDRSNLAVAGNITAGGPFGVPGSPSVKHPSGVNCLNQTPLIEGFERLTGQSECYEVHSIAYILSGVTPKIIYIHRLAS